MPCAPRRGPRGTLLPVRPRLGPDHDHAAGGVRAPKFTRHFSRAAVDLDPVNIADGRALLERVHLDAVDPPCGTAPRAAGHDRGAFVGPLVALDSDPADGA